MQLTNAQKVVLKNWVIANNNGVFEQSAVVLLNAAFSPTYKVWKTSLNKHDMTELPDVDAAAAATGFALGGTGGSYIGRSVAEKAGWVELWNSVLACKPYLAFVRVAMFDIFSGTDANSQMNRKHFWARGQRAATVVEHLLRVATVGGPTHDATNGNAPAGQTGARGTWTNPDTLGTGADGKPCEGPVTLQQVQDSESAV